MLRAVHKALRPSGVFYISLKYADEYKESIKDDIYGRRLFYLYTPALIEALAGKNYENVFQASQRVGNTDWFTIALEKK